MKKVGLEFKSPITNHYTKNRVFSHDIMAAMLMFQNKEMAAVMVYQTNPQGIELHFLEILSFVSVIQYGCWSRE